MFCDHSFGVLNYMISECLKVLFAIDSAIALVEEWNEYFSFVLNLRCVAYFLEGLASKNFKIYIALR